MTDKAYSINDEDFIFMDGGRALRRLTTSITGPLQRVRVDAPVGRGR